jgi:hypothetical protein
MVCQWFGLKTIETIFSDLTSKLVAVVFFCLASKSVATVFSDLASKPVATFSPDLSSKLVTSSFSVWILKPAALVWCFRHHNHCSGFLVWTSKLSELQFVGCATKSMGDEDGTEHTSKSSSLLHVEVSRVRVSQSGIKIDGSMGDARDTIVKVT